MKLRLNVAAPAPDDAHKRARLTQARSAARSQVRRRQYCPQGPASCRNLDQLSDTLARSRNYDELTEAWRAGTASVPACARTTASSWRWRTRRARARLQGPGRHVARGLRHVARGVRCRVRAAVAAGEAAVRRAALLCARPLAKRYGKDKVPAGKPIPAQLLGNMWRSSGTRSIPTSSSPIRGPALKPPTPASRPRSGTRCA